MKNSEIPILIKEVINGLTRINDFNDDIDLKKCYGDKVRLYNPFLKYEFDSFSPILFFINGEDWCLDDHEIAITLCSLLPETFLKIHYLENKNYGFSDVYNDVYNYLQDHRNIK